MIPLGEIWHVLFELCFFLCLFLELRFFICHSASCMVDFVPKSIITGFKKNKSKTIKKARQTPITHVTLRNQSKHDLQWVMSGLIFQLI